MIGEGDGDALTGATFSAPSALSTISPLGAAVFERHFSFDGMTRINGKVFDPSRIDFQVPADQIETWTCTTSGNAPHPVHVHGASFQVVSRTGGRARLFPWQSAWKDTVLLNDGETVSVKLRVEPWQRGQRYQIHCHKLEHEDAWDDGHLYRRLTEPRQWPWTRPQPSPNSSPATRSSPRRYPWPIAGS